jgi:hypothetical protein
VLPIFLLVAFVLIDNVEDRCPIFIFIILII